MQFRSDINGLRALAVIAVVLFHLKPSLLPGGFIGVDVFFVISGFLMTSIVMKGIENQNFSYGQFFLARATRIVPALAVLCLVLLAGGWWALLDEEYKNLATHSLSSVTFFSNFVYWTESGYFSDSSLEKWLLHTWSLSVEWQFYLTYPLFLMFMKRYLSLTTTKFLFMAVIVAGIIMSIVYTASNPVPAYYLLPTRAWEMMFGGLIYFFPLTFKAEVKPWLTRLGLALIAGSLVFVDDRTPWPGIAALVPVTGTWLILLAQQSNNFLYTNPVSSSLGKWSYSIYLWHWPIVVVVYQYAAPTVLVCAVALVCSVAFGAASYHLIEKRCRSGLITLGLTAAVVISSAFIMSFDGHFPFRQKSQEKSNEFIKFYTDYKMDPAGWFDRCNAKHQEEITGQLVVSPECYKPGKSERKGGIFLWGDSFVGAIAPGIRKYVPARIPVFQLTSSGCNPILEPETQLSEIDDPCEYSNALALAAIKKQLPDVVVLGQSKMHEETDWTNIAQVLLSAGVKKVVILGPVPQWSPSLPSVYIKRHEGEDVISDKSFNDDLLTTNTVLNRTLNNVPGLAYVDLLSALCDLKPRHREYDGSLFADQELPHCKVMIGNRLIAFDYGHLTSSGAQYLTRKYVLDEISFWRPTTFR